MEPHHLIIQARYTDWWPKKHTHTQKPEESFTNDYVKELYESEHVRTATKLLHVILDAKYEKEDLHKVTETHCQHLTMTQRNEFLKLIQIFEEFLMEKLAPRKQI